MLLCGITTEPHIKLHIYLCIGTAILKFKLQLCILFAALFLFSLTELELRRHSQLFLFLSCAVILQRAPSHSPFSASLLLHSAPSIREGRERERELSLDVWNSWADIATITPLPTVLPQSLSVEKGYYLLQTEDSFYRSQERGKKSERERKTRTKATTG